MVRYLSDESSMASHPVVNYSSSSYGGYLFRSPNSPPPSPTPSPPPSIASLSQLFLHARSRSPVFCSSPACFQLPMPPLLPLPRRAALPAQSRRISAASSSSRRHSAKRKGKVLAGTRNQTSPPPIEEGKDELLRWQMRAARMEEREMQVIQEELEMMESVFLPSPPPSCLPFPRFSLRGPKANSGGGGDDGVSRYCTA